MLGDVSSHFLGVRANSTTPVVNMTDAQTTSEPKTSGCECIGVNLLQPIDYYYTPK